MNLVGGGRDSNAVRPAAATVARHNPYAHIPGMAAPSKGAMAVSTATRGRAIPFQPTITLSSQQHIVSTSGGTNEPSQHQLSSHLAQIGASRSDHQGLGSLQQLTPPQADPSHTEDLVTTYSSFAHDPVDPYAVAGSAPFTTYNASGNVLHPFEYTAQTAAVTTAHQDADLPNDKFGEMTELQL